MRKSKVKVYQTEGIAKRYANLYRSQYPGWEFKAVLKTYQPLGGVPISVWVIEAWNDNKRYYSTTGRRRFRHVSETHF